MALAGHTDLWIAKVILKVDGHICGGYLAGSAQKRGFSDANRD